MIKFLAKLLSTFFYIGYLPFIPGTFGSLAGVILFLLAHAYSLNYLLLVLLITAIGFWAAGRAQRAMLKNDPPCVIIDEVSGMLLSLLFIPYDIKIITIAFVLFRILDTLKPFPAGRFERLKGGIGIMADDIVAGVYTNIILQVALRVTSFKVS